jgi:gliding motility-associated protein GldM
MAGGKETPRQKMIGMMYLVLTALLAMNISKDVLNAFIQINKGLGKTNTILEQKAEATIDAINNSKEAQKAKPFQDKAAEVDKMTDDLMAFMTGRIAKWWLPDAVELVDAIPHTATGKIKKTALREMFRDYRFRV